MKKMLLAIGLLVSAKLLLAQPAIKDANAELRQVSAFHTIKISHAFDVYLTQGEEEGLAVSAVSKKYADAIKTEVKDGELHITFEGSPGYWNTGKMKLKAYVSFKTLKKIAVSGASDVRIMGTLKADNLEIDITGASDLRGKIEVKKLEATLSGASDIKITGASGDLKVQASGASNFKGYDFAADYCYAEASGASDIQIMVNKELAANASGASDIHYKGEAVVREMRATSASSIKKTGS